MPLGMEVVLGPGDIVFDGDPAPPMERGAAASPHFSAHVCCDQTAGWIRIPLCMEVGLGPGDVLDGDPAPPPMERGTAASLPLFGPSVLAKRSPISATAELLSSSSCSRRDL